MLVHLKKSNFWLTVKYLLTTQLNPKQETAHCKVQMGVECSGTIREHIDVARGTMGNNPKSFNATTKKGIFK